MRVKANSRQQFSIEIQTNKVMDNRKMILANSGESPWGGGRQVRIVPNRSQLRKKRKIRIAK